MLVGKNDGEFQLLKYHLPDLAEPFTKDIDFKVTGITEITICGRPCLAVANR